MKIKIIKMFLLGMLSLLVFSSCSKEDTTSDTSTENSVEEGNAEESADTNETVDSSTQGSGVTELAEVGLSFNIPTEYVEKGISLEQATYDAEGNPIAFIYFYNWDVLNALMEEVSRVQTEEPDSITEEYVNDFYAQVDANARLLMYVTAMPKDSYDAKVAEGLTPNDMIGLETSEVYGENDGYVYIMTIPALEEEGLNEDCVENYKECYEYIDTLKENMEFIPIQVAETDTSQTSSVTSIPTFTATDLNGEEVTNDIFAQKDLTVLNVWGTFCTPCIEEMPELAAWSKEMPENVQIVGLIADITSTEDTELIETANTIVSETGVEFVNIIPTDDFTELLLSVTGVPTTFFVDKEGNIVGEPIIGANVEGYKSFVTEYLGQ